MPLICRVVPALSLFCSCLALMVMEAAMGAEGGALSGQEIYRRQCVECHGRQGEGVAGKHADPLHGDWSVDRLARYIARSMPEDAPERCVGEDATAVAGYIHQAFYSPEARARNNPARVELVRLTNLQLLNTIADLLKEFTGTDRDLGEERGLRGSYYDARNFNREKKIYDRVDPQVNFDYGDGVPDPELITTNEFSMQWRGSVVVEDTGDYEFVLKTPNGARLWVNDDNEPLIDAWVASGDIDEHRAKLRLLGGRAYPIRLDYFKFKDKTASISLRWRPPHGVLEPIPRRNLAPARTTPTFVVQAPLPPDDSSMGYERGVGVSKAWDDATTQTAIEVANHVVRNLGRLTGSKLTDPEWQSKVEGFCAAFVSAATRRPLSPELKRVFVDAHFETTETPEEAARRVVLLTLKSPRFLYLGIDGDRPDGYSIAARLSYGLWDSLPDRALRKRAEQGELSVSSQITAEAERMIRDPRTRAKMRHFLQHWLQMHHVEEVAKDESLFPGFSPEIIADLRISLNLFLDEVFWSEDSDYRRLLLGEELYLNSRVAAFYGVDGYAGAEFVRVSLDSSERAGVITHPYLLAAFSYPRSTSPIHRGVFLTRNIVGRALKPPPVAVEFKESDFAPDLTMREKVTEVTRPEACQTCHSAINPLGFSLEHFDAVGRFRTRENDRPVDAASDYATDDGRTIRLKGARDVAQFAVESDHARTRFVEMMFHQVVKQPVLAYGPEVMSQLSQKFAASEFNMRKLLLEIILVSARHGWTKPANGENKS